MILYPFLSSNIIIWNRMYLISSITFQSLRCCVFYRFDVTSYAPWQSRIPRYILWLGIFREYLIVRLNKTFRSKSSHMNPALLKWIFYFETLVTESKLVHLKSLFSNDVGKCLLLISQARPKWWEKIWYREIEKNPVVCICLSVHLYAYVCLYVCVVVFPSAAYNRNWSVRLWKQIKYVHNFNNK